MFLNLPEITNAITSVLEGLNNNNNNNNNNKNFYLEVVDLSTIKFVDQILLMSTTSVVVGMHGAGISMTMFMDIGGRGGHLCCGVVEMFPVGEVGLVCCCCCC